MRHVILTCKHHPFLRWSCKEVAYTEGYGYNGSRNIFFMGEPYGKSMHSDGWRLQCIEYDNTLGYERFIKECPCPPTDLILAPEDVLVRSP